MVLVSGARMAVWYNDYVTEWLTWKLLNFWQRQIFFCSPRHLDQLWCLPSLQSSYFLEGKQLQYEADISFSPTANVRMSAAILSLAHVSSSMFLIKHRDNFIFLQSDG